MRVLALALVITLAVAGGALAGDSELLAAKERYLPRAQLSYPPTPDGAQAGYDAGRDLVEAVLDAGTVRPGLRKLRAELLASGRAQVRWAEALDRPAGSKSAARARTAPDLRRCRWPAPAGSDARAATRASRSELRRRRGGLGARARHGPLRRRRGRHQLRGGVDREARRACCCAPRGARARAQPLVVRRSPDRLLVVESRGEPDRPRPWLRRHPRRPPPARDDLEHVSRAVSRDDGCAAARPAHARDDRARPRPRALPAPRRRPGRPPRPASAGPHAPPGDARAPRACLLAARLGQRRPVAAAGSPAPSLPRRTAGSRTRARRPRSSTAAARPRSSSSRPTGRASPCPRRSASGATSCARPGWLRSGPRPRRLRREPVERLLQLAVERLCLRRRVADRRQPDAARHGQRAHHVQRDSGLALGVPAEAALGDDVEQVVRRQRLVRRSVEVVGRDVVLDVAEPACGTRPRAGRRRRRSSVEMAMNGCVVPPQRRLISIAYGCHSPFCRTATKSTALRPITPSRARRRPILSASAAMRGAYSGSAGKRQPKYVWPCGPPSTWSCVERMSTWPVGLMRSWALGLRKSSPSIFSSTMPP